MSMVEEWLRELRGLEIPHSDNCNLVATLGDPVKIRNWQIAGLPRDTLSVENGVIVQFSQRWPLFIDPQGQANKWTKSLVSDLSLHSCRCCDNVSLFETVLFDHLTRLIKASTLYCVRKKTPALM